MPKFFSDGHFSGSSTDLTIDGQINISGQNIGGVTSPSLYLGQLTNAYQAGMQSSVHLTMKTTNNAGNFYWYRGGSGVMYYSDALYVNKLVDKDSTSYYLNPSSTTISLDVAGRITRGSKTFGGGNGVYADTRLGIVNNGSLTSIVNASTYNDANFPDYGLVFIQGPSTSSYNVWSISPDGPAKGSDLNFIYQAQATNIHTQTPMLKLHGSTGNATFSGDITAGSFVKSGGTSSQFLMADGSVSTSVTDTTKLPLAGGTLTGNLTLDDGSGESPHIIFQDDDDIKFRVYNADNNDFIITRQDNGGADFVIHADTSSYTSSYLTIGGSTVSPTKIGQWNTAYGWGNHASAGYLTSLPSHNHDDRYYTETESRNKFTSTDGAEDNYTFEIEDEGNFSGNKWYHVATVNSGNGGLHIRGAMLNHVENFASQKFDLAIQVREGNDGGQLEITGSLDVLHNETSGSDRAGIRIIKTTDNVNYDEFRVYIRTTRYQMLTLRLTQQGQTTFNTNHSSPLTSEPAPVSGGHVELDTSSTPEGNYVIDNSTIKEINH